MNRASISLGVALGLALALLVLMLVGPGHDDAGPPPSGPVWSECDGTLRELVIQYVPEAASFVGTAYRDLLTQLPADVTVYVACPDQPAFDDLRQRVGVTACALRPVLTGHALTTWARDRWVARAPLHGAAATMLVCPREEAGSDTWPARRGDEQVAFDLAGHVPRVRAWRSALAFDGGDFTCDDQTAFVIPAVMARNLQHTVPTTAALTAALHAQLGKRIVLLDTAPDHHAGMFMMVVGERRVLVGDPALARKLLAPAPPPGGADAGLCPPEGPDFSAQMQARFDAVAQRCAAEGYQVTRIPVVPGRDGRTYVTYVNALIDQRASGRTVYLPTYRGAEALNRAATQVWRDLGYTVRQVDCTEVYGHFGSLHCLVNVLQRESALASSAAAP